MGRDGLGWIGITGNAIRETDLMCLLPHLRVMRKLEAYQELRWLEPYLPDMQRMAEWL